MITIQKLVKLEDVIQSILEMYYSATPPDDATKQIFIKTRDLASKSAVFLNELESAIEGEFGYTYPTIAEIKRLFENPSDALRECLEGADILPSVQKKEGVFVLECKKDGKEYFTFEYRGTKKSACRFSADLVISEMGDGDGENGGKGSLKNCIDEIAEYFRVAGNYAYADCIFRLREVKEGK